MLGLESLENLLRISSADFNGNSRERAALSSSQINNVSKITTFLMNTT